jgi:hypothetical protein
MNVKAGCGLNKTAVATNGVKGGKKKKRDLEKNSSSLKCLRWWCELGVWPAAGFFRCRVGGAVESGMVEQLAAQAIWVNVYLGG